MIINNRSLYFVVSFATAGMSRPFASLNNGTVLPPKGHLWSTVRNISILVQTTPVQEKCSSNFNVRVRQWIYICRYSTVVIIARILRPPCQIIFMQFSSVQLPAVLYLSSQDPLLRFRRQTHWVFSLSLSLSLSQTTKRTSPMLLPYSIHARSALALFQPRAD